MSGLKRTSLIDRRRATTGAALVLATMAIAVAPAAGTTGADAHQLSSVDDTSDSVAPTDGIESAAPSGSTDEDQRESVNGSNESAAFSIDADVVERCGVRCRTVRATLTNTGNATATNATATVVMSAGDSIVWRETYRLGNISGNDSIERTDEITVGLSDAFAITRNRGWLDISVTVDWDDGETVFTERRQVA